MAKLEAEAEAEADPEGVVSGAPDEPAAEQAQTQDGDDEDEPSRGKVRETKDSASIKAIRAAEDEGLRSALDQLGKEGTYKIRVKRISPEWFDDPRSGKRVQVNGTLKTYTQSIDEDYIQSAHGGGRFQLTFLRLHPSGSFRIFTSRTVDIAGDPRLDDIPRTLAAPQAAPAAAGESPGLVKEAFSVLRDQLDRAESRGRDDHKGIDPAVQMMLDQMRRDAERRDAELAALRRDLAEARNTKPAEDPLKDKLLDTMLTGERGHVESLRLRYEAEVRQAKDAAVENERRILDRHDREMAQLNDRHERDMSERRNAHEREINAMRTASETAGLALKSSFDMQVKLLEADLRRLERDNAELRSEVKDLRLRKDKTIVETAKELQGVKEALGLGEGEGAEKSSFDKILEAASTPAAVEAFQKIIGGVGGGGKAQPEAPAQARQVRQEIVRDPSGKTFLKVTDGNTQRLIPAKKKPKVIPATQNADGTVQPAIELPEVDEASVAQVVGYLEKAFSNRVEPAVVAQSGKSLVPEPILTWIRNNDGDVSGVDLFMSKVAKLPSTSPLATLAGQNWLRKVGKALIE